MPLSADEGGDMIEAVLVLMSTASGVAIKAVWDTHVKKQQSIELNVWKLRNNQLEKRLSEFYWLFTCAYNEIMWFGGRFLTKAMQRIATVAN
jgi:hypothetical protein